MSLFLPSVMSLGEKKDNHPCPVYIIMLICNNWLQNLLILKMPPFLFVSLLRCICYEGAGRISCCKSFTAYIPWKIIIIRVFNQNVEFPLKPKG